jgi:RHS repeat-associated protein
LFNGLTALARIDRDEDGERSLYFHNDHTGRPQICTDDRGQVAWQWTGDSFGAGVDSGVVEQNIRMPGQYFDEETGLSYNRYRYYDPRACRYLQPDPIVRPTDVSRYAYPTDPLSRIDPLGLTAQIVVTDWRDPVLNGGYVDQGDLLNGQGYTGEFEGNASRLHFKNGGELPKYMHDAQPPDLKGVTHVIVTGHGGFEGIEIREPDGTTQIVGGEELADYLKKKGLTPENGVQVTLVACHTGAARPDGSSVARDLAQALGPGAVVHAPTDYVCVLENGDVHVLNGGTMEQFVYREPTIPTNAAPPSDEEDTHRVPTVSDSEDTRRIVAPPDDGSTQRIRAVEPAAEDDFSEDSLIEPPKQVTRAAPPGPHNDNDEDDPPIEPPPPDPVRQTQDNGSGIEDDEPTQVTKRR